MNPEDGVALLREELDVDVPTSQLLHHAAYRGKARLVCQLLVRAHFSKSAEARPTLDALINKDVLTPLAAAYIGGRFSVNRSVQMLLAAKANPYEADSTDWSLASTYEGQEDHEDLTELLWVRCRLLLSLAAPPCPRNDNSAPACRSV